MGESTHEWAKRQKLSATQSTSAVCEDCGRKWTATLAEVPVTVFIKDLDEYYLKISKNLLEEEEEEPPMVLCVFRPSDRDPWDIGVTLSCVAPRQDSPYQWSINHKHNGPAATSVCQIIPRRDKNVESKGEVSHTESDIVTIKEEIKKEIDEEMVEVMNFDPLIEEIDVKPDINSITASGESENSNSCQAAVYPSTSRQYPALKRPSEDLDDPDDPEYRPADEPDDHYDLMESSSKEPTKTRPLTYAERARAFRKRRIKQDPGYQERENKRIANLKKTQIASFSGDELREYRKKTNERVRKWRLKKKLEKQSQKSHEITKKWEWVDTKRYQHF